VRSGPDERARFRDRLPEEYPKPDLNPYLKLHRDYGPPVVTGEQAQEFRGRWGEAFGRQAPLQVEIGPGNGFHLVGMARRHPDQNWLGVEIRFKRVVMCADKLRVAGVGNARVARYDAFWLDDIFEPGEVWGLHVHFPDPWARERDGKHRLLGPHFAGWVARALRPGGELRVKTDHRPNLDRLADALDGLPLRVAGRTDDVVVGGLPWPADDDVVTNYETKFNKRGEPVFAMRVVHT